MKRILGMLAATSVLLAGLLVAPNSATAHSDNNSVLETKRANLLEAHLDARRSKCGPNSLSIGNGANNAAQYHARDMAHEGYFSHNSQNPYEFWADRIERFVTNPVGGENIAYGFEKVGPLMDAWMDSPGHRANILNCNFRKVGFGFHYGDTRYYVADFLY